METNLGDVMATFAGILILASVAEALVEYYLVPLLRDEDGESLPMVKYVAMIVGIALAIAYNADVMALLGLSAGVPLVGQVVTGALIGRGSNFLHDFYDRVKTPGESVIVAPVVDLSAETTPKSHRPHAGL